MVLRTMETILPVQTESREVGCASQRVRVDLALTGSATANQRADPEHTESATANQKAGSVGSNFTTLQAHPTSHTTNLALPAFCTIHPTDNP